MANEELIVKNADGSLNVPDHPIIPFIEGDGIGPDIWRAARLVMDGAVEKAYAAGRKITCNARMGPKELEQYCSLDEPTKELLHHAMCELKLSARAYDRILKVARTIADLAVSEPITADHISEAIQFRSLDRQIWG